MEDKLLNVNSCSLENYVNRLSRYKKDSDITIDTLDNFEKECSSYCSFLVGKSFLEKEGTASEAKKSELFSLIHKYEKVQKEYSVRAHYQLMLASTFASELIDQEFIVNEAIKITFVKYQTLGAIGALLAFGSEQTKESYIYPVVEIDLGLTNGVLQDYILEEKLLPLKIFLGILYLYDAFSYDKSHRERKQNFSSGSGLVGTLSTSPPPVPWKVISLDFDFIDKKINGINLLYENIEAAVFLEDLKSYAEGLYVDQKKLHPEAQGKLLSYVKQFIKFLKILLDDETTASEAKKKLTIQIKLALIWFEKLLQAQGKDKFIYISTLIDIFSGITTEDKAKESITKQTEYRIAEMVATNVAEWSKITTLLEYCRKSRNSYIHGDSLEKQNEKLGQFIKDETELMKDMELNLARTSSVEMVMCNYGEWYIKRYIKKLIDLVMKP